MILESAVSGHMRALRRWLTWRRMVHLHLVPRGASWSALVDVWLAAAARAPAEHRRVGARLSTLIAKRQRLVARGGEPISWSFHRPPGRGGVRRVVGG